MGVPERQSPRPAEALHPGHFYAAYIFDDPAARQADVRAIVTQARHLGYPTRYWWLSDAMELGGAPDRLIVCVHHPSTGENAGMDLYERLRAEGVTWDELEAATMEEYGLLSRPIESAGGIFQPDGQRLVPFGQESENGRAGPGRSAGGRGMIR